MSPQPLTRSSSSSSEPEIAGEELRLTTSQTLFNEAMEGHEAQDLVWALVDAGINDSKCRSLRSQVRYASPDQAALDQIEALHACRDELSRLVQQAQADGHTVRVRSTLEVTIEPHAGSARTSPQPALANDLARLETSAPSTSKR